MHCSALPKMSIKVEELGKNSIIRIRTLENASTWLNIYLYACTPLWCKCILLHVWLWYFFFRYLGGGLGKEKYQKKWQNARCSYERPTFLLQMFFSISMFFNLSFLRPRSKVSGLLALALLRRIKFVDFFVPFCSIRVKNKPLK